MPPLPADRVRLSDLKNLFSVSEATVRRKYRPSNNAAARAGWTVTLDIHRPEGSLALLPRSREGSVRRAAAPLRQRPLAHDPSPRAERLP